jgi:4-diphosphocytidyl-2-C-methyl-D-erythritol kinase
VIAANPTISHTAVAPAKLNLSFRVLGRRADGYHEIESLVAFAALADTLTAVRSRNRDPALVVGGPCAAGVSADASNLVLRAVAAACEVFAQPLPDLRWQLVKHVPAAAGLGGGSGDAGAALRLLARQWQLDPADPRWDGIAGRLGADVPVCRQGAARFVTGTGTTLHTPIRLPPLGVLLVNPLISQPTPAVFAARTGPFTTARRHSFCGLAPSAPALLDWLGADENGLTAAAISLVPEINDILAVLRGLPGCRLARMSGSGASCFGLFDHPVDALQHCGWLSLANPSWWVWAGALISQSRHDQHDRADPRP